MKAHDAFRLIGRIWLYCLVAFLFLGLLDGPGIEPDRQELIVESIAAVWAAAGIALLVFRLRARRLADGNEIRATFARWLAALGGGVAGAAAVCVANHLFPGRYTDAYDFAPELLLMCLVGAPVGLIALAFRSRLRWTVFFAFALSLVFVGWGVLPNFR